MLTVIRFGFGVSENMPYCFRGHRPHSESDNKLDAHITNFDETFAAMMAAKGLFDAHQVPDGQGRRSFLDRPFPYGLLNPAVHVLDELAKEDNRSVDMIISIGGGEVADKDIPDLLHLAGFGDPVGVTLPLVLPKAVTDTCSCKYFLECFYDHFLISLKTLYQGLDIVIQIRFVFRLYFQ
jgi:hypothetical protein